MNKNKPIKENLKFHLDNSFRLFNNGLSFQNAIQQELDNFDNITWFSISDIDIESFKESSKKELKTDKELSSVYFNFLHGEKLTFIFDEKRNKKSLILDGYIREEESYPMMEIIN
ncbi:hypothetical protein [Aquimarina sediminis]|uniref:hypothetical protein n=1 Tax=Aquimarina sediminis TaxID=2070536 RepID=UPI000CA00A2D|nr:hypothetical protein [Aquimarina sediminis]